MKISTSMSAWGKASTKLIVLLGNLCILSIANSKVTMETVIHAIRRKPPGAELMVAGDFNGDILAPEGRRVENIATDLATAGVEDMAQHFMPRGRRWCRDRRTWDMQRQGQVVRSRTDYILGTDRRLFKNVAVRDPWHNTDHYMVLGCLPGVPLEATWRYQGGRKR